MDLTESTALGAIIATVVLAVVTVWLAKSTSRLAEHTDRMATETRAMADSTKRMAKATQGMLDVELDRRVEETRAHVRPRQGRYTDDVKSVFIVNERTSPAYEVAVDLITPTGAWRSSRGAVIQPSVETETEASQFAQVPIEEVESAPSPDDYTWAQTWRENGVERWLARATWTNADRSSGIGSWERL